MTADVIRLVPDLAGDAFRIEGDAVLEAAKGREWHRMCVIGQDEDGELYLAGTANAGETMILLERARHFIAFGHDDG